MPDITMCKGVDCPNKESCYRFTAEPSHYQSYFSKPPYNELDKTKCEYYWEDKKKDSD